MSQHVLLDPGYRSSSILASSSTGSRAIYIIVRHLPILLFVFSERVRVWIFGFDTPLLVRPAFFLSGPTCILRWLWSCNNIRHIRLTAGYMDFLFFGLRSLHHYLLPLMRAHSTLKETASPNPMVKRWLCGSAHSGIDYRLD